MNASSQLNVQVSATEAAKLLPAELTIDDLTLEVWSERSAESAFWGRDASRFRAHWYRKSLDAKAHVEIRPASTLTSELVVTLDSPSGFWGKIVWSKEAMTGLALRFARGLRYEIETKHEQETDAFAARWTNAGLVKQRSA